MFKQQIYRFLRSKGRKNPFTAIFYLRSRGSKKGGRRQALLRALHTQIARVEGRQVCLPRQLDKEKNTLIAVWDYQIRPFNSVEIIYWQMILLVQAKILGRQWIDIYLILEDGSSQSVADSDKHHSINNLAPLFYLNPQLRNCHVYHDRKMFETAFAGANLSLDNTQSSLVHLRNLPDKFYKEWGSLPTLTTPIAPGILKRSLGIGFREDFFFISIQLGGWEQADHSYEWLHFIELIGQKYPKVKFLLFGPPSELAGTVLSQPNVFSIRSYGFQSLEETAIIRECDLFMGLDTGLSPLAVFSDSPYLIFISTSDQPRLTELYDLDPTETRFPFAGEHQRVINQEPSCKNLLQAFENSYQVLKAKPVIQHDANKQLQSGEFQ